MLTVVAKKVELEVPAAIPTDAGTVSTPLLVLVETAVDVETTCVMVMLQVVDDDWGCEMAAGLQVRLAARIITLMVRFFEMP